MTEPRDRDTLANAPLSSFAVDVASKLQSVDRIAHAVVKAINENIVPLQASLQAASRVAQSAERAFQTTVKPFLEGLQPALQKVREAHVQSTVAAKVGQSLEKAGWFPHGAIPLSVVTKDDFEAAIPAWIDANGGTDWSSITKVHDLSTVGQPAKESFATAVSLYQSQKYNAALRVIFPEIEACAFEAFYRALGISWSRRSKRPTRLLELQDVIRLLWRIGSLGALFDARGVWLPQQEQIIRDFCYTDVDQDNVLPAQLHFPNRHAVAHGVLRYDCQKACINGLLIADVMFRGIHAANVIFQKSPSQVEDMLRELREDRETQRSSKKS
ncbi:hypothetical protein [Bradyrhizobium sp. BR 10289]|uniref:hypothetical protein n=1 Tax=Bradyrhizobium sp. BR 10289 TaxID=2749993 RepID=UPI001C64A511|nr:hypothetical protein [Bradyrhizobium sp. BR 10289]MBW7974601.1 hypothetical protein [Bradyrhizobium sp. BR 10289]